MQEFVRVKGMDGLAKDLKTGAVVNVDTSAYEKAKAFKKEQLRKKRKEAEFDSRLSNVEDTLSKILNILEGKQ